MPKSASPPAEVRFGRYRLVEELGAGGMAVVYRAIADGPQGFQRAVVVKRILPELSKNPRFVKMFLSEARLCALLHHPAIVQVNDLGEVNGEYFLAMELVEGVDLSGLLRHAYELRRPMPPGVACYIASELAGALAYAHALKGDDGRPLDIVHRDVSPSNIRLTPLGGVKLLDFGIARAASHLRDERTLTGTLKGKISYMSPEQAEGLPVDRRADIFALGIVLYECLTLERLFRGADDFETLRLVREAKVWPPSSARPDLDPEVDAVVARMLARSPETRYATCDEVAAALEPIVHRLHGDAGALKRYLQELGPIARVSGPSSTATTPEKPGATPRTVTRSSGELRPSRAAERGWLWPALAALVMAAALGGVFALGRAPSTRPPIAATQPKDPGAPIDPSPKKDPHVVVVPSPQNHPQIGDPSSPNSPHVVGDPSSQKPPREVVESSPQKTPRDVGDHSAPKAPPAPTPGKVRLVIGGGPPGALVLLDGEPRGKLPLELTLDAIARPRNIVVKRAGYDPWTATAPGDRDQHLDAQLQKREATSHEVIKDPFAPAPRPRPRP